MGTFNSVTSAVFDLLLGWFGQASGWIDILLWSFLGGIMALLVYKAVSNQKGIAQSKNDIKVHLLEIRLFQDDILGVFASTLKILFKNLLYLGHNVLPMVVMFVPFVAVLCQLEANYAFAPMVPGSRQIMTLELDRARTQVPATAVRLELPPEVVLEVPPVRTRDAVAWRLRMDAEGDHRLRIHVGDEVVEKGVAVGGELRKVPVLRTKSWKGFLYPGEPVLPEDSGAYEIGLTYPVRDLGWLPGGEFAIVMEFLVLSLAVGFAMKGVFGVTL